LAEQILPVGLENDLMWENQAPTLDWFDYSALIETVNFSRLIADNARLVPAVCI
jgi:hypothetical protein